jgi:hypothetical protein
MTNPPRTGGNQVARTATKTTRRSDIPPSERNDRHLTPIWMIGKLGVFDLDPCGAPGHTTARAVWNLEDGRDGLAESWDTFGRVWLNPPYGSIMRTWVEKLRDHPGGGIALIPASTGTKMWQEVVFPAAQGILFWPHRINFLKADQTLDPKMVSVQASAFVAFSRYDAKKLRDSDLPGAMLDFRA